MNKLIINLTPQEVSVLGEILGLILTGNDIAELKKNFLNDYLLFSCVHELFNRLDSKTKDIQAFGHPPKTPVKVYLKRHEALALFILMNDADDAEQRVYLPAVHSAATAMIMKIRGTIHKHYLI